MGRIDNIKRLPRGILAFWSVVLIFTALCAVVMSVTRFVLHYPHPFRSPFFPTFENRQFLDFFDFLPRFSHYHHLDFFSLAKTRGAVFSYPAPLGVLYALFYLPADHRYLIFTAVTGLLVVVLVVLLGRAMVRRGVAPWLTATFLGSISILSYPYWFNWQLGNLEICVFIILAFGIVAFLRGKLYLAATLIAIAGSMKIFPLFLLGIFLSRRRYRELFWGLAVAVVTYFFSVWMECPSFRVARSGSAKGADAMQSGLILRWLPVENSFDHSLFSLFKAATHLHYHNVFPPICLTLYMLFAAVLGLSLYFLYIQYLPLTNQLTSLYVAAVLLPPMSHHYTLMQLYVPWGALVLFALDSEYRFKPVKGVTAAFVCFGILFSPQAEFIFRGVSLSGPIKTVVLCTLWFVSMKFPFESTTSSRIGRSGQVTASV